MGAILPERITPSSDLICQELDGEMVILDLKQERYFGLDEVGCRIWQLLSDGTTTEEILRTLQAEFEVDEQTLTDDLNALYQQFVAARLVQNAA